MDSFGALLSRDTVRLERLLPGPIERVWDYIVDPAKRRLWLATGDFEPFVGGRVALLIQNANLSEPGDGPPPKYAEHAVESQVIGEVTECDPPHLLAYRWDYAEGPPSEVKFELEPRRGKVLLTMTHMRLPSRDEVVAVSSGWHAFLDILVAVLSDEKPKSFWRTMTALDLEYDRRVPPW